MQNLLYRQYSPRATGSDLAGRAKSLPTRAEGTPDAAPPAFASTSIARFHARPRYDASSHWFSHTAESGMIAAMDHAHPARDEYYMRLALREAQRAADHGDVPIGAVVVLGHEVIGAAGNERELRQSPLAHCELLAIEQAAAHLRSWRLLDTTLYVTLEPCPMCAGAVVQARIPRLVYGATDEKAGAAGTLYNVCQDARLNHCLDVTGGVLADESVELLQRFFRARR